MLRRESGSRQSRLALLPMHMSVVAHGIRWVVSEGAGLGWEEQRNDPFHLRMHSPGKPEAQ